MMGNVIATVVYNAQLSQNRLIRILAKLGSLANPNQQAALTLLTEFAQSKDRGDVQLLATSLEGAIVDDAENAYREGIALLGAGANHDLFAKIAEATPYAVVKRRFALFRDAVRSGQVDSANLTQVFTLSHLWAYLEESAGDRERFGTRFVDFATVLGEACQASPGELVELGGWAGLLLDTSKTFANTYLPPKMPFAMHRRGYPVEEDLVDLRQLLAQSLGDRKQVILPSVVR